ncbi:MAG TPA: lamin tail domain-containing protein [Verrucomicrobiae bacterium]|nr:lamin tail domain-containing protein [Verrucomicrobiae bacterium]
MPALRTIALGANRVFEPGTNGDDKAQWVCLFYVAMFFQIRWFVPAERRWVEQVAIGLISLLSLMALPCRAQSPAIIQQPQSQTIFYGDPATFQVSATGSAPLNYQWFKNDVMIPAATSGTLALPAVSSTDHDARFWVRVTNSFGSVTSSVAVLTVDFGQPGSAITNRLLNYSSSWQYNQSNNLDGVTWYGPAFNASGWPVGPGLLGAENNGAIVGLMGTTLLPPNTPPAGLSQGHAYYFRATVNWTNDVIPGPLIGTFRVDDGAMIYVNGNEALRIRMPNGPITNRSFASAFPPGSSSDATTDEVFLLQGALTLGTNVIAASVHQQNLTSSDVVWGMTLDAVGYQRLRDIALPILANLVPAAGSSVPVLTAIEVHFSEGVKGVDAGDLLINGSPATNVIAVAPDLYVFQFPQPPTGSVQVDWAASTGILDLSANSNYFAGGSYSLTLDPSALLSSVRISEFMAGNDSTIRDNDGQFSDWIELYNGGSQSVSLGGWYLTDDAANLTKWRFPNGITMPAGSYLLVWASDKNRTNPATPLHTNFKLSKSANGFLALVYSNGVNIVSAFTNLPVQYDDVSYGRDSIDLSVMGYFTNATPATANATLGLGFAPEVQFSRPSGTFQFSFPLTLSAGSSNTVIRYFLVTNAASAALADVPNDASPIYTGPLSINSSVQVRARAYPSGPNLFPGPLASKTYVQINSGAAAFVSDVPIVLLHNFSGGTPPATVDQSAVMMVFGTSFGRASMLNPPDTIARIGLNIRGSSTQGLPKKSFAVEAWDEFNDDLKIPILDLPAESDWVLYAPNSFDKSLIHNPLMHELSRQIGRYSPRVRMVEVFTSFGAGAVNYTSPQVGNYNGIYVLEEKIKADANRVEIADLDPEDTNAPAITGGYIMKVDRADADERTLNAGGLTMVYVEPQMKDYAAYPGRAMQESYLAGYFNSFNSALNGPNWTNPVTGYAAWIDVDSWVDHHILNVVALSSDALRLSAYFFKDRNKKIEMGPLWDFDRALGTGVDGDWRAWSPLAWMGTNPTGGSGIDYGTDFFNSGTVFSNPWYRRLAQDPDFWQKWIDRYQSLRKEEFSTNSLFALVDRLVSPLSLAQPREQSRWLESTPRSGNLTAPIGYPDRSYLYTFPGNYQGEIAFQKKWLADRLNFMDTNFLDPAFLSRTGGLVSVGQTLTITPAAKANTRLLYTLNGTDPRLPGGAISPAALSNNGPVTLQITNNIRVFARSWNPTHQNLTGAGRPPISSPWSGKSVETFYVTTPPLRITEIMYNPRPPPAGNTNDSDNFEFIELKNISATSLNLQGFRLSGGIDFAFSSLTLTGNQSVVVVRNLAAFQSRYGTPNLVAGVYTNNLGNSGDHLVLQGPLLEPILDFEFSDSWYPTTDAEGFSLVLINPNAPTDTWELKESWQPSSALNGSPGVANPAPPNIPRVVITEVLTHTDPPLLDTVELFNPTAGFVNLGGWFLTDDPHQPKKYRITAGTLIGPNSYLTFNADQFDAGAQGFAFSSTGDQVYLFSGDASTNLTGYAHGFDFGAAPNSISFGRYVNSQGAEQFVLQRQTTLGANNAYPQVGPVVMTEVMYHPPDLAGGVDDVLNEFIELQNVASTNVPLYHLAAPTHTWRLGGGVDFNFPTNLVLAPGEKVLVVGFDPAIYPILRTSFVAKYGVATNVAILGPWIGKLDNGGETVVLEQPDNPNVTPTNVFVPYYLVEKISYSDVAPWPVNADGLGASLQRIEPTLFGNDPMNWQAAMPTAGQVNPAGVSPDADHDGLPDVWEMTHGIDAQDPNSAASDLDGDGATNGHEYIAGTNPANAGDYLRFSRVSIENQICTLEFSTRTGRTYAVESLNSVGAGSNWTPLATGIIGNGGLVVVTDPLNPAASYYRVKVSLSP